MPLYCLLAVKTNNAHGGGSATSSRYSADIKYSSAFLIQQLMISSFIPLSLKIGFVNNGSFSFSKTAEFFIRISKE